MFTNLITLAPLAIFSIAVGAPLASEPVAAISELGLTAADITPIDYRSVDLESTLADLHARSLIDIIGAPSGTCQGLDPVEKVILDTGSVVVADIINLVTAITSFDSAGDINLFEKTIQDTVGDIVNLLPNLVKALTSIPSGCVGLSLIPTLLGQVLQLVNALLRLVAALVKFVADNDVEIVGRVLATVLQVPFILISAIEKLVGNVPVLGLVVSTLLETVKSTVRNLLPACPACTAPPF